MHIVLVTICSMLANSKKMKISTSSRRIISAMYKQSDIYMNERLADCARRQVLLDILKGEWDGHMWIQLASVGPIVI